MSNFETTNSPYASRAAEHLRKAASLTTTRARNETIVRVLLIGGCLGVAGVWLLPEEAWLSGSLGLALIFAAGLISIWQGKLESTASYERRLAKINQWALARKQRDWAKVRVVEVAEDLSSLPLAKDLDLFGEASLFSLCCTAETRFGVATLAEWFLKPTAIETIEQRQLAVSHLADQLDWRQQLQQRCGRLAAEKQQTDRLIEWCETDTSPATTRWLWQYAKIAPVVLLILIALWAYRPTAIVGFMGVAIWFLVNLLLTVLFSGRIHSFVEEISPDVTGIGTRVLSPPFEQLSKLDGSHAATDELKRTGDSATDGLRKLERCLLLANLSRNPFTAWLVYIPLQFLGLWDLHIDRLLHSWRSEYRKNVRDWLEGLGRAEALASLASLRFDEPNWCFPNLDEAASTYTAESLAHPLLNDDRVGNDVSIGPASKVLLLTGSNMSGKSTLLRAVGLNAVLAQAGGPCCCSKLTMPRIQLLTCMRVADSLQRGESLFMAELLRLKTIVEVVDKSESTDPIPLYLLDEILSGTNSDERRVAVESVIGHLIKTRAIGAVSTHDLELARESKIKAAFQHVHLRETYADESGGPELTFDYKLRDGIATSTNALKLVRMIGLQIDE